MNHGCYKLFALVMLASTVSIMPAFGQAPAQQGAQPPAPYQGNFAPVNEGNFIQMMPAEAPATTQEYVVPHQPSCDCRGGGHMGHYNRTKQMLNRIGTCCYAHHDEYGCDSLVGQLRFMFGSCRAFMGFRCTSRPPVIPTPPGYSLEWGYGRWR